MCNLQSAIMKSPNLKPQRSQRTSAEVAEKAFNCLPFHRRHVSSVFAGLLGFKEAPEDFSASGLGQRRDKLKRGGRCYWTDSPSDLQDQGRRQRHGGDVVGAGLDE